MGASPTTGSDARPDCPRAGLPLESDWCMRPIPKPPARVRRVLDVEPLERKLERFLLRPFVEIFDRGAHLSPLILRGELCGADFQVSVSEATRIVLVGTP